MERVLIVRGFELLCTAAWLYGLYWVWKARKPVYAGVYFASSTLMTFDWIFNTNWFFRVVYSDAFIPLWKIQGVVQPIALVFNYAFFFGVPVLFLVERRAWLDQRFGRWGYAVVFLFGAVLDLAFEVPATALELWTYYQAPQFRVGGLPWSNVWYSGLLLVASYAAARLAVRWAGEPDAQVPGPEARWKGFAIGAASIWSAFYASMTLQLIWYALAQPWTPGPRPF